MKIIEKEIKGIYEIKLEPYEDHRGFFMRAYDDKIFKQYGIDRNWVQENHSLSLKKGVVRGLHFQYPPNTETKLLRVVTGEIFFTFVDIRKNSPTFGKWGSIVLSANKKNMLFSPRGFAMGMCTLTDNCNLLYKVDNYYTSDNEDNIKWNDPDLGIKWPVKNPIVSKRDSKAMSFKEFVEKHGGLEV